MDTGLRGSLEAIRPCDLTFQQKVVRIPTLRAPKGSLPSIHTGVKQPLAAVTSVGITSSETTLRSSNLMLSSSSGVSSVFQRPPGPCKEKTSKHLQRGQAPKGTNLTEAMNGPQKVLAVSCHFHIAPMFLFVQREFSKGNEHRGNSSLQLSSLPGEKDDSHDSLVAGLL